MEGVCTTLRRLFAPSVIWEGILSERGCYASLPHSWMCAILTAQSSSPTPHTNSSPHTPSSIVQTPAHLCNVPAQSSAPSTSSLNFPPAPGLILSLFYEACRTLLADFYWEHPFLWREASIVLIGVALGFCASALSRELGGNESH